LFFEFSQNLDCCEFDITENQVMFVDMVVNRSIQGRAAEKSEIRNVGAGLSANKKQIINQI
jgi:hypothetical protein